MSKLIKDCIRESKKDLAYEAIKEEIINHQLKPGTKLVERQLCDSLNISRTPIREALHQLAIDGLVSFQSGEGAVVSDITYEVISETYDVRKSSKD